MDRQFPVKPFVPTHPTVRRVVVAYRFLRPLAVRVAEYGVTPPAWLVR